jgi:hypothetical protein
MVKFVIWVTQSPTEDNVGGFEAAVLVGQARCLSHHFGPKYVTEFVRKST